MGRFSLCIVAFFLVLAAAGRSAPAASTSWQHDPATPGDWQGPANWTNGLPQPEDRSVVIDNGGTAQISSGVAYGGEDLYLGDEAGTSGTVELSATGELSSVEEHIGRQGTGRFVQTGGTHSVSELLRLGRYSGSSGTYELLGGVLSAEGILYNWQGHFVQSGGTNIVGHSLEVGGTYDLSGTGELSSRTEGISGSFSQLGGQNSVGFLDIRSTGKYSFLGGALEIGGGLRVLGTLDFGGRPVAMDLGDDRIVNFSGKVLGGSQTTFSVGSNSLTILAPGFDPNVVFASFSTAGMVHTAGTELVVAAGEGFAGSGIIDDHVTCEGTIDVPPEGRISLAGGLTLSGEGHVEAGEVLHVDSGVSEIISGQLSATYEYVGYQCGSALFTQSGGRNTVRGTLYVGYEECDDKGAGHGVYELSGSAELIATSEYIGRSDGYGEFIQTGGSNTVSGTLCVGRDDGYGAYHLSDGELTTGHIRIGEDGHGEFVQSGGTNIVTGGLHVAVDGPGTYQLSDGELTAAYLYVGEDGRGEFVQSGGTNTVTADLHVGYDDGYGMYQLSNGELTAANQFIGYDESDGEFVQTGGVNTVTADLHVGYVEGAGIYHLSNGELSAVNLYVGCEEQRAEFSQTGGTNTISADLYLTAEDDEAECLYRLSNGELSAAKQYIGTEGGSDEGLAQFVQTGGVNSTGALNIAGTYSISAGSLTADDLSLDGGTLEITDPAADVTVASSLHIAPDSTLTAAPGASIHMTGSAFENESTDPTLLEGLNNVTLIFEGGNADIDPFEVAGEDIGPVLAGFQGNFALEGLQLGGVDVGMIQLVDNFDNQPGVEALYVKNLCLGPSAYLDLNGLNLYYLHGTIDPTATILGGSPTLVPEPSCFALALSEFFVVLLWQRRERHRRQTA